MGRAARRRQGKRLPLVEVKVTSDIPPEQTVEASHDQDGASAAEVPSIRACVSASIWFVVLLYGLLPSQLSTKTQLVPERAWQLEHDFGVPTAAVTVASNSSEAFALDYISLMAQLKASAARHQQALRQQGNESLLSEPFDQLQGALHPDLARLIDLCPLLRADGTKLGFPDLCDDSHYRMPCTDTPWALDAHTLSILTLACHSSEACRAWWMHQHNAVGMSGCPIVTSLTITTTHIRQEPKPALTQPAEVAIAQSRKVLGMFWCLLALGKYCKQA